MPRVSWRSRRAPQLALIGFLAVMAVGQSGCREAAQSRVLVDLVQAFPAAVVNRPTGLIDLGDAEARRFQVTGWHEGGRELEGGSGTWSIGDRSEIEFVVLEPRDLDVVVRCSAIGRNTRSPRSLQLSVNGSQWESIELTTSLQEYRLALPRRLLRDGPNRLQIENPPSRASRPSPKQDVRVLWDYVDFGQSPTQDSALESLSPVVRQDGATLFIPFGARVDFYLENEPGSRLTADAVTRRGGVDGRLLVTWEAQSGERSVLTKDLAGAGERSASIPATEGVGGRLALTALPGSAVDPDRPAGMVLRAPRILVPDRPLDESAQSATESAGPREPARPNIVIYMVDTLRADRLGVYGRAGNPSPRIDGFAKDAVVFANAQAQSPWTRASVASVFTGLWPQVHGAQDDRDKLVDGALTLAERLSELGYETAGITSNGNAHGPFGFAQGFDHFEYLEHLRPGEKLATSEDVHNAALSWMDIRAADKPFFLYLHTIDPHAPYDPPERHRARQAPEVEDSSIGTIEAVGKLHRLNRTRAEQAAGDLLALYDAEVSYNDESFGRLLDELRTRSLYEDSLVILVSDHGEEFFEHGGWSHGQTLYSEMLDVPLIIKLPRGLGAGKTVAEVAEHVDLVPTIMDLVTARVPAGVQGRSLLPTMLSEEPRQEVRDWAVSNVALRGIEASSLIDGEWKLILRSESGAARYPELYSRSEDSVEAKNLAPEMEVLARLLASRLAEIESATGGSLGKEEISQEDLLAVEEQLRALGYLE